VLKKSTRQRSFFAKYFILPRVFYVALGKERVQKKQWVKYLALGKEQNSGSDILHYVQ
jgi:hypothetical protein